MRFARQAARPRALRRFRAALALPVALGALLVLPHCGSDPAATHVQSARNFIAEGRTREALIAYNNAIKVAPDDAQVNFELAQVLTSLGELAEARFHYDEAYRLDPEFSEAAVRLASLTSGGDPAAARQIVDEILRARPDDAWGHLGLAQLHLESGDVEAALAEARAAATSDPELAEAQIQLARVHQARIATHFAEQGAAPDDSLYQAAMEALARAEELSGGGRPWRSTMGRAQLLAWWPGHEREARDTFQQAYAQATEGGDERARALIIQRAIDYARRTRNGSLLGWSLTRQTELRPFDTRTWESLAQTAANRGGSYEAVLLTRIHLHPEDAAAHTSYAAFLARERGIDAAEKYLLEQVDEGRSDTQAAELLASLARLQQASGAGRRALETAGRLAGEYPEERAAILLNAWRFLGQMKPGLAIGVLSEHEWVSENAEALSLLVDCHTMLGNVDGEVFALQRLLELLEPGGMLAMRVEARIAHHRGEHQRAITAYTQLRRRKVDLSETEVIWLAQSAYGAGLDQLGRTALADLVERPQPSLNATGEFARREFSHPIRRRVARKAFDLILAREPKSRKAILSAVQLEVDAGERERALARLDTAIEAESADPGQATDLRVQKAELLDSIGRRDDARTEAWAAFEARPQYPRALPVLVALYADEATEEIGRRGNTIGGGLTPTEHAFVGRLHELTGNERLARWSFEQALNGGVDIPILRNDLAYLLAKQKTDLDRALLLAQQARQRLGDRAPVADTLGYVQLASGDAVEAERQFKRAVELAKVTGESDSQYRFHLALAMKEIGKTAAATKLVREVLKEDPNFPEADEAQRMLRRVDRERDSEKRREEFEERRKAIEAEREKRAAEAVAAAREETASTPQAQGTAPTD